MEVRKLNTRKTWYELVKQRPSHMVAVMRVSSSTNGRRRTISPRGQMKIKPAA
jgi:hypothetical protein